MVQQYTIIEQYKNDRKKLAYRETEALSLEATFACEIMRQLSIATAAPDGEDSSGRQKLRLLNPDEVAYRACSIAEHAFAQFRSRGWTTTLPDINEIYPTGLED